MLKAVLRGKIITLTAAYRKDNIEHLESIHKQTWNLKVYRKLLEERKKLEALEITKIQRRALYLNQKYWMLMPKFLKLLAWKVKTKQSAAQIYAVRNKTVMRQTLTSDILQTFSDYYTTLYSSAKPDSDVIEDFFNSYVPHLKLTEEHVEMLDEPNKLPGLDGFRPEFYKVYATKLISLLALTFNEVLTHGTFPLTWNDEAIVVLPKKGRDVLDTKSYRPIKTTKSSQHFSPNA